MIEDLLGLDRQLLVDHSHVFDDTVPFLRRARDVGRPVAFVSNCAEHTRSLLDDLGLLG